MAQPRNINWRDVVDKVQKAGIEEHNRIKQEQKGFNRQYAQILQVQIAKHREQLQKRSAQKHKQRQMIEKQIQAQKQKEAIKKLQSKNIQLQYQEGNSKLIEAIKASKELSKIFPENPFVRLVDGSEKRQQQTKEKMKMQNNINEWQNKIRIQQNRLKQDREKQQRNQYNIFVDKFYDKKAEDRNTFKKRYLKLNHFERSNFIHKNNNSQEVNVENDYQSVNSNQIEQHRARKNHKDEVEGVLLQMNLHADIPSGSPAFIGRNPINHDRKKQLQIINRGMRKGTSMNTILKTQPDAPISNRKKQSQTSHQLPIIQSFYTKTKESNAFSSPSDKHLLQKSEPLTQKPYKIKSIYSQLEGSKGRMNTEPAEPNREPRKFIRFDIIQGKNREVLL